MNIVRGILCVNIVREYCAGICTPRRILGPQWEEIVLGEGGGEGGRWKQL